MLFDSSSRVSFDSIHHRRWVMTSRVFFSSNDRESTTMNQQKIKTFVCFLILPRRSWKLISFSRFRFIHFVRLTPPKRVWWCDKVINDRESMNPMTATTTNATTTAEMESTKTKNKSKIDSLFFCVLLPHALQWYAGHQLIVTETHTDTQTFSFFFYFSLAVLWRRGIFFISPRLPQNTTIYYKAPALPKTSACTKYTKRKETERTELNCFDACDRRRSKRKWCVMNLERTTQLSREQNVAKTRQNDTMPHTTTNDKIDWWHFLCAFE